MAASFNYVGVPLSCALIFLFLAMMTPIGVEGYGGADASCGPLKVGYYNHTCPTVEAVVRGVLEKTKADNFTFLPAIVRMIFHDAFVRGADASILLDPTAANPTPEKTAIPNNPSLIGYSVIDEAKSELEKACPGVVSCADIIAFAARDATYILSNNTLYYDVPAGRLDGRTSIAAEVLLNLPSPFFNLSQVISSFIKKNLTVEDAVVLSGAHTVGRSHCSSFSSRLYPKIGPNLDLQFAKDLQKECPFNVSVDNIIFQDHVTPKLLDSQYYRNVLAEEALFDSDEALLSSKETQDAVIAYAYVPGLWEKDFAESMVKLSAIEVKTGTEGEIRKNCRVVN